jgi:hypothetical protein
VDLASLRRHIGRLWQTPDGKRTVISSFLASPNKARSRSTDDPLEQLMSFRSRSISAIVRETADLARARGLKVGLDCFSPTLAPMVGQNVADLSAFSDWIKGMTYIRAFGPASIPFEIFGLIGWLRAANEQQDKQAMMFLAEAAGWDLPADREAIRRGGLSSTILTAEISRGRKACACPFRAGIEMVDVPGVAELNNDTLLGDLEVLAAATPEGIVLSWDLRHIPPERWTMINRLLNNPHNR